MLVVICLSVNNCLLFLIGLEYGVKPWVDMKFTFKSIFLQISMLLVMNFI